MNTERTQRRIKEALLRCAPFVLPYDEKPYSPRSFVLPYDEKPYSPRSFVLP